MIFLARADLQSVFNSKELKMNFFKKFKLKTITTKKTMRIQMIGLISLLFLPSCERNKTVEIDRKNEDAIKKIIIQNYPSFHLPSMFLLDIENREIIFHRIGQKEVIEVTPLPEGEVNITFAPKSYRFAIDSVNYQLLYDSIICKFSSDDYKDKYEDYDDGKGNSVLYIFESGKSEDITLSNSYTDNQNKLIKFLITLTESMHPDSLSKDYLRNLGNYYY